MIHSIERKWTVVSLDRFYSKTRVVFWLRTGEHLFLEVLFQSQHKENKVPGNSKIALCLGYWHIFTLQLVQILNAFNTSTLKKGFLKK